MYFPVIPNPATPTPDPVRGVARGPPVPGYIANRTRLCSISPVASMAAAKDASEREPRRGSLKRVTARQPDDARVWQAHRTRITRTAVCARARERGRARRSTGAQPLRPRPRAAKECIAYYDSKLVAARRRRPASAGAQRARCDAYTSAVSEFRAESKISSFHA